MNTSLRISLLSNLWGLVQRTSYATAQELYGVAITARIEELYVYTLDKFLTASLPCHTKTTEAETGIITYEFPPKEECIRHMLYEVLLKNRTTFTRFIINTYCTLDEDSMTPVTDLWAFITHWAREQDIPVAYIPVALSTLSAELEELGYTKVKQGFWGFAIADH